MKVTILRLGHRFARDKRISTHIGLVSRAFGAQELILDAIDEGISESVSKVCKQWGGKLKVSYTDNWKKTVQGFEGDVVHLTMYGINVNDCIEEIRSSKKDKLVIVGGQKVPSEVYQMAGYNVAVGNQPHSEVAALSVFLDRLYQGKELEKEFKGKKTIIPQQKGKKVVED
jgi:tRNA (cytidine56-2'-O)-methyltransferase